MLTSQSKTPDDSTAFHPQTDGASECSIRMIAQILHSMISPDQKDWAEKLPMVWTYEGQYA